MLQPLADRPGEYANLLKLLRRLIRRGIALQWLTHDPSAAVEAPASKPDRSWTDEEIAQFRTRWPLGTKQRTAFEIHLCIGMRRSDVHRVTSADIRDGKTKGRPAGPFQPSVPAIGRHMRVALRKFQRDRAHCEGSGYRVDSILDHAD